MLSQGVTTFITEHPTTSNVAQIGSLCRELRQETKALLIVIGIRFRVFYSSASIHIKFNPRIKVTISV